LFAPEDEDLFAQQWYLENTGQDGGVPDADVDAITAWGVARGAGVLVAVVDSGVDGSHPDLVGQLDVNGFDFVDDDLDPSPASTDPDERHGTAVAAIIAAAENGVGMTGIAPEARILPIRSCDSGSCGSFELAAGIGYAVDQGADIVNLSLGAIIEDDPVIEGAIVYAREHDVLVVTATGNESRDLDELSPGEQLIPGGLPYSNILNVASSDDRDLIADFSNFGPSVVDIVAPGERILSTGADAAADGWGSWRGTSFSAPIVAGVAALLLTHEPGIGHQEVLARITGFVDKTSGVDGASASGRVNAGRVMTRRFVDSSGSLFVNAIDWLADEDVTRGCNPPFNHRFCPDDRVTRGEMAVFLSRAFNLPATTNDYFNDDDGTFYEASANRLRAAGLTVGCGSGRYCGADNIRRDEMATMLARALSLPSSPTDFFDDDTGSIFENAINKVGQAAITTGCNPPTNNLFCPDRPVTRGEMAAFMKRSLEL
jgi:hypothetical protein